MIYYVAPSLARPSGGVRTMYRHVDVLNEHGLPAAVVHARPGFRCTWFANSTRVEHTPITLEDDILVFPEQFPAESLDRIAPGVPKVVLNQNTYRTFGPTPGRSPYGGRDVTGTIVVSRDNQRYLEFAALGVPIRLVRHWIDASVFHPTPRQQQRRITAIPHKRPHDFHQVQTLLQRRGRLDGWAVVPLRGLPEHVVAAELRRSPLFLSFAHSEGFGLPTAEALASGCFVIGFAGQAGRELLVAPFAACIEDGDVVSVAAAVEDFVEGYDARRADHERRAADAAAWIHATYSREQQAADLTGAFAAFSGSGSAATSTRPDRPVTLSARELRLEPPWRPTARRMATRVGRLVNG